MKPKTGSIGLGTMGKPMALNGHGAGFPLRVYNRSPEKTDDLLLKDLTLILETAGRVGAMLPGTAAARETASGARGMGLGDEDMAAVVKVLAGTAGLRIGG